MAINLIGLRKEDFSQKLKEQGRNLLQVGQAFQNQ